MNAFKLLTCAVSLSLSATVLAEVQLTVPSDVELLAANEEKAELSGGLFASNKKLILPDGENQIVFRYVPVYSQGGDDIQLQSKTIIATFSGSDARLRFELPKYRSALEAKNSIDNLAWRLMDQTGSTLAVNQDVLDKDGFQIGRDYADEAKTYNLAGGKAALSASSTPAIAATSTTKAASTAAVAATAASVAADSGAKDSATKQAAPTKQATPEADNTAEEMLHFWYNKADKATQERFKQYINQL
ncbi:DUF2057 family protein [Motilimonas eburnea]|uniref:DUF2057 family protein n=1 Tax=Motilimonas eburnea TaxID=1737488 RepID=UPI001E33A0DD|nr:DUF2057 family protein [Motilimonas eburnea]MCE2571273.1 DUF2057 family protein [Motilimonas eburnea]